MSRTYKYPRESLEDPVVRTEFEANLRIEKRLERQKQRKKRKIKTARSFMKYISFRDRARTRGGL